MFLKVIIISLSSLLIGAIAFALLNKKSNAIKSKERNTKLATYILLIFLIYASIAFVPFLLYVITVILIFIALREILNASSQAGKMPYFALLVSGTILYMFAFFIKDTPPDTMLFTYFIVVHFDGFSQVSGESFGKRKIFPKISPAKTWEGLIGGFLVAIIVSLFIFQFNNIEKTLAQVTLIVASAFAGDVLASFYKRFCGIKDYGNLIPGHGGVLDRFDSFFMAGAVIQALQMFYTQ